MLPRERAPCSAIIDRPPLKLPGGARVVVWTIVNLEEWDVSQTMPPAGGWPWPSLTKTWDTPDILVDQGYDYVCD